MIWKREPNNSSESASNALTDPCSASTCWSWARPALVVRGEALYLRWEDVDFEGGFLRIASGRDGHRTKSGKGRWVPMTTELKDAVREHFACFRFAMYRGEQTTWVFHHPWARRRASAGERIQSLRRAFAAAAKMAKLPAGLHQHDLRHRRVATWLTEGKNPVHVKEALGHTDLRTTMGYTHLAREHLKFLVEARVGTGLARVVI